MIGNKHFIKKCYEFGFPFQRQELLLLVLGKSFGVNQFSPFGLAAL